ncbi:hypothetical protein GCM10027048_20060 [Hymenobacter coalescens]
MIETLSTSVRDFSEQIGESSGNTNNYIGSRQLAPKHEYLAKVLKHFSNINAHWLITGEGDPFTGEAPSTSIDIDAKKNKGNVQSTNSGSNTINHITLSECQRDLEAARKEAELLREHMKTKDALLDTKDALIAAKEEVLTLLRGSHNRPN